MRSFFKRIVDLGVYPDTPADQLDEIRAINSIKFQGAIMVVLIGVLTTVLLPNHVKFTLSLTLAHVLVAVVVFFANHLKYYRLAKWLFIEDPAILILILVAYFGIGVNFHYVPLICFLVFLFVFRKRTTENLSALAVFLVLSLVGILLLYIGDVNIAQLNEEEVKSIRLAVYLLSAGLAIMMGIVIQQSSRKRIMKAEHSLKESQSEATILQTISDNMDEAIFKSSLDRGFIYFNRAFYRMFGYESFEEMMNVHPVNLYVTKTQREALLVEVGQKGKLSNKLMKYRRKDGSTFWGRLSTSIIEEHGESFLVGTVADVTLQQEQTALLQENERRLKESQRLAKIGSWRMCPEEGQVDWRGECASIHEFLPSDEQNPLDIWASRLEGYSLDIISKEISRSSDLGKAFEFGTWYNLPDGDRKFLYYYCELQREESGKVIWQGTVQDRTDLKLRELEIDATRAFYQNILENVPVELVLIDSQLRYYYLSENAVRDQETRAWLIGKTNEDYARHRGLPLDFAAERDDMCRKALASMLTMRWEEKMVTRDGRDTYHLRNVVPVMLEENGKEEKFLIGYSFDINDIKRAQFGLEDRNAELNQLNKELDRFVYSISHDLRAPIASVLGLNALAEETVDKEELNSILIMQREALDRLDRYIRDVIDYSRNKRLEVTSDEFSLKPIIDECLSGLAYLRHFDKIEFFIEVDEELKVVSDQLRIKIIINNLLSNAVKYADTKKSNPFVTLKANADPSGLHLVVQDNGIGIKQEFLEQIWDIFFRATSTVTGSGLGLYILKESVKNLNGTVEVESSEGEGTTFKLFIPSLSSTD